MAGPDTSSLRGSLIEAVVWTGIVVVGWIISGTFAEQQLAMSRLGPELWPRAILLIILVIVLGQLVARIRERRAEVVIRPTTFTLWHAGVVRTWATFLLPILWVALLPRTGFYLATPIFLAAYLVLLGERRVARVLIATAVIYGIAIVVFTVLFYVPLPVGTWPGFYDFSNWLLGIIR